MHRDAILWHLLFFFLLVSSLHFFPLSISHHSITSTEISSSSHYSPPRYLRRSVTSLWQPPFLTYSKFISRSTLMFLFSLFFSYSFYFAPYSTFSLSFPFLPYHFLSLFFSFVSSPFLIYFYLSFPFILLCPFLFHFVFTNFFLSFLSHFPSLLCHISVYLTCGSPFGREELCSDDKHSRERTPGHEEKGECVHKQPSACTLE